MRIIKRVIPIILAVGLIFGLSACEINDSGSVSTLRISKTCSSSGAGHVDVQVFVKSNALQNYDIIISINDGLIVTGQANVSPGGSLSISRDVNASQVDVSVTPSDGSGVSDIYDQPVGACTV
jgi:hypothetical protein